MSEELATRALLACPDCGARPSWVHDRTGWAKCSRCELAWPALERAERGATPAGAVRGLPPEWRLSVEQVQTGDYRSSAVGRALWVELRPLPSWDVAIGLLLGLLLWLPAFVPLLLDATPRPAAALFALAWMGAMGVVFAVPALVTLWWRRTRRRGLTATLESDRTKLAFGGRPPVELGAPRSLRARPHGRDFASLVLETSDGRETVLVEPCDRALCESLLREMGRALGLRFARPHGQLVASTTRGSA